MEFFTVKIFCYSYENYDFFSVKINMQKEMIIILTLKGHKIYVLYYVCYLWNYEQRIKFLVVCVYDHMFLIHNLNHIG